MYLPREDSIFLSELLLKYLKDKKKEIKILDMGSGSGIQAETCLNLGFNNVVCVDIDPETVKYLKKKGLQVIKSNLFSKVRQKFDLIIFNPPYLPSTKFDRILDTTGGKLGDETIIKFLNGAKSHINKNGKILLLLSSFTPMTRIDKLLKKYKTKKLVEKKLFYETLYILELSH